METSSLWRRLFDPAILLLVASFSAGLTLATYAGLFGIPLALILVSWFLKYAYALLDDVAFGAEQAPVLSLEMVNPVSQRPLGQLAIGLGAYAVALWTEGWARIALLTCFAFAAPASIAILAASGRFLQAMNPLAWVTVIRALGLQYIGLLAFAILGLGLVRWMGTAPIWPIAKLALVQLVILSFFYLIGAALYSRRDRLDLDVLRSPERSAEQAEEMRARLRSRMLDDLYAHVRVRKYANLESTLAPWLEAAAREELRIDGLEILRTVAGWRDARALAAIAQLCIARLHDARLIGEALDAWELALKHDAAFRPTPPERAAALAELAALAGKRGLARAMFD